MADGVLAAEVLPGGAKVLELAPDQLLAADHQPLDEVPEPFPEHARGAETPLDFVIEDPEGRKRRWA